MLGIESKMSMVFYPQTDEQTERMNQVLEQYLRMFIDYSIIIDLIDSRCSTHGLLLCFISLYISNSSVSASLVGHVLYLVDLMSAICISHFHLMVHRYIYSRYSSVFLTLYQLYHSLPFSTLISSSSLYLKLQPELLLKVITHRQEQWPE